jgi:glutathione reductase (NADPH)
MTDGSEQAKQVDLAVLGCGVAGQTVAYRARQAGWSVTLFETGPPGGTCPTRGCDAKKPLVNAVFRLRRAQAMMGKGLSGELSIDWPALMAFKRSFTEPIPDRTREDLAEAGIELIEAPPRFDDARTIEADGRRWRAEQVVISTGLRPRALDLERGGAEHAIDSDAFLELDALPERVVFVGGGYVSMEFASVAAAAGSAVTVLERAEYPLSAFDPDAVRVLLAAMHEQGIKILTRRQVTGIEPAGGAFRVHTGASGEAIEADLVVNASGRVPSIDGLGLDNAGIAHGEAGVAVDAYLRSTSSPNVWAAGDVAATGRAPLTPTAAEDGRVVAHNLLNQDDREMIRTPVASVCFTYPPIASVGLSEHAARQRHGDDLQVAAGDLAQTKHFRQEGETHGFYKMIFDPDQRLLGAHFVGGDCEEVINLFALAIGQGCDKHKLCETTMAYPTVAKTLQNVFIKQQ